jgi:hypothetical protein
MDIGAYDIVRRIVSRERTLAGRYAQGAIGNAAAAWTRIGLDDERQIWIVAHVDDGTVEPVTLKPRPDDGTLPVPLLDHLKGYVGAIGDLERVASTGDVLDVDGVRTFTVRSTFGQDFVVRVLEPDFDMEMAQMKGELKLA